MIAAELLSSSKGIGFLLIESSGQDRGDRALVIIALVFSVISLFYYMRIAAAMYLAKPREGEAPEVSPGPSS